MKHATLLAVATLAVAAQVGCSGAPAPSANTKSAEVGARTFTFRCTAPANASTDPIDGQRFQSFDLTLDGRGAKIDDPTKSPYLKSVGYYADLANIVYSDSFLKSINDDVTAQQKLLDAGQWSDGTPLSDQDKADAQKGIDNDRAMIAANGSLAFHATYKPYVRTPKHGPTARFSLTPTTDQIDADSLWEMLGKEGNGAVMLMPPSVTHGSSDSLIVEYDGTQGPVFDHMSCTAQEADPTASGDDSTAGDDPGAASGN